MSPKPMLEVGYVSRAHGLQGELGIKTFDPASTAFEEVQRAQLRSKDGRERVLTVESVRPVPQGLLVVFAEVNTREESEALVGSTVQVFREDLELPADGEFFQGDLIGLTAVDEQGNELGKVAELWETGPVPNLVIKKDGSTEELVIPFADEFVPEVDLARGRVVVRPPEFLE